MTHVETLLRRLSGRFKKGDMAKTIVQTREALTMVEDEVAKIAHRFSREFGEQLLIRVDSDGQVTVGVSLLPTNTN